MRKPATKPRGVNDGRVPSLRVNVSGARRLLSTAASLPWPPPSAPGGLDHEEVIATEFERCFSGQPAPTSVPHEEVLPRPTVIPALEALRPKDPAFRENRCGPLAGQEPDGAANPVASRVTAPASGAGDESVFFDSERVRKLERFDGRVAGVRHVRVHPRHPGPVWEGALASRDRLVVGERPRIRSADCQVVHRPLTLRGDRVGQWLRERQEEDVNDSLGGLDVPGRHGGRRARPYQTPLLRQHPERPEGTGISRRIRVCQASHDVRSGAQGHGEWRIQIAGDLTIRAREIHRDPRTANRDFRMNPDSIRSPRRGRFEELFRGPGSPRQFADGRANPPLSIVEELVDRLPKPCDADSLDEFDETPRPELVGGDLRSKVSEPLQRIRCLPAEFLQDGPSLASSIHHLLRLQHKALIFETHRGGWHRADHLSTDIRVVRSIHREPDDRLPEEHRPDERHVRQVVPPRYGSFRMIWSPSRRVPGKSRMAASTATGIDPRWTGMCSACETIRPSASNSAQLASIRSLTFGEYAVLRSAIPISSG